jgi:hypothetical protein
VHTHKYKASKKGKKERKKERKKKHMPTLLDGIATSHPSPIVSHLIVKQSDNPKTKQLNTGIRNNVFFFHSSHTIKMLSTLLHLWISRWRHMFARGCCFGCWTFISLSNHTFFFFFVGAIG